MRSEPEDTIQQARKDKGLAVIEGVQALKHAVRFGAEISDIITCDIKLLGRLLSELAPDISQKVLLSVKIVDEAEFNKLSKRPIRTKTIALARRKDYSLDDIDKNKPIVFLEDPRDLENIGAVIRVAAAADAGAVIISGDNDIWHPNVIRGGAGLHFALPVFSYFQIESLKDLGRELIALEPTGREVTSSELKKWRSEVFIFGTERSGISQQLLDKSDVLARLPMRAGVSSLNLATSVAATLYQL